MEIAKKRFSTVNLYVKHSSPFSCFYISCLSFIFLPSLFMIWICFEVSLFLFLPTTFTAVLKRRYIQLRTACKACLCSKYGFHYPARNQMAVRFGGYVLPPSASYTSHTAILLSLLDTLWHHFRLFIFLCVEICYAPNKLFISNNEQWPINWSTLIAYYIRGLLLLGKIILRAGSKGGGGSV